MINSQENVFYVVYFSKVGRLRFRDCNSINCTKRILKKRTSTLRTSHPSSVEPATLPIMELTQDLFKEARKILMKFSGKTPWRKLFLVTGSGSIFAIFIKTYSTKEILRRQRVHKISHFKILENPLLDVFFIPFLTKLQPFSS